MLLYSLLLVIIPGDSCNVHDEVARRLEPYEGELVVEEREVRCTCVERALDERAERANIAVEGTHSSVSNHAPSPRTIGRHREWLKSQPDAVKPDPHCMECLGTGRKKVSVEFRTAEHGWCIGGRNSKDWAQYLNAEPAALREFAATESDPELREYIGNVIPVKLLLDDCPIPTGIVTPDGEMHSLFIFKAQSENGMARWVEFCRETYAAHVDCLGVVCDYRF